MKCNENSPKRMYWKIVLEDAVVLGGITLISGLISGGYPPKYEVFYMAILNAALVGLYSWARARGIKHE